MFKNIRVLSTIALVVLIVAGGVGWLLVKNNASKKGPTDLVETPPPPAKESAETLRMRLFAERIKLATVGKGEGIEHALIRQLMADPTQAASFSKLPKSIRVDMKGVKLKRFAEGEAHRLAIRAKYVDVKFGSWVGVRVPNHVAYLICKDAGGNMVIEEYIADQRGNFGDPSEPANVQHLATSISQAHFLGWPNAAGQIPPPPIYEYYHFTTQFMAEYRG